MSDILEPFQMAFGARGGSQSLAHIRSLMEDNPEPGAFAIKIDWEKWYYSIDRAAIIKSLAKHGLWAQLQAFLAAFGGRGQGSIVYYTKDGSRVVHKACVNGLPPGHPISGSACSLPVVDAWNEAQRRVLHDLLVEAGSPPLESAEYRAVSDRYFNSVGGNMYVDDAKFYGNLHDLRTVGTFVDINEVQRTGTIAKAKTVVAMLDGSPAPPELIISVSVALATISEKAAHADKVNRIMQQQVLMSVPVQPQFTIVPPDVELARDEYLAGGSTFLGAIFGNQQFVEQAAYEVGMKILQRTELIMQYPQYQGRALMLRLCNGVAGMHLARVHGADRAFQQFVHAPHNQLLKEGYAEMLAQDSLDPLQELLMSLPLRRSGAGIPDTNVGEGANVPFLAAHLAMAHFVERSYQRGHIFREALVRVQDMSVPGELLGVYGAKARSALMLYRGIVVADGAEGADVSAGAMTLKSLVPHCIKFQNIVQNKIDRVKEQAARASMSLTQAVAFKAQCAKGAGAMFAALPVRDTVFFLQNSSFTYMMQRRFLNKSFGACGTQIELCNQAMVCRIGNCREPVSPLHFECCTSSSCLDTKHDALRDQVKIMLADSGVSFDHSDLRAHSGILNELAAAGAVASTGVRIQPVGPGRASGNQPGADLLVHSLEGAGRSALDFTITNDRTRGRVAAAATLNTGSQVQLEATLEGAEAAKKRMYAGMYATINVKFMGVAMDLAGNLGPGLQALIRRCEVLAGSRSPMWANWASGNSFFSAWRQRIIVAVQAKNAECALENWSRSASANVGRVLLPGG